MPKPLNLEFRTYSTRGYFENFQDEIERHAEHGWTLVAYTTTRTKDTDALLIESAVYSRRRP